MYLSMYLSAHLPALLSALISAARADTISLDTGATLTGDLARYELDGDCQISVTQGDLRGVILVLPCRRIQSFVRAEPPARPALADAPADAPALADAPPLAARPVVREIPLEPVAPSIPAPVIPPLGVPQAGALDLPDAPDDLPDAPGAPEDLPEGGASPAEPRALRF